jgi:hypothetical protein
MAGKATKTPTRLGRVKAGSAAAVARYGATGREVMRGNWRKSITKEVPGAGESGTSGAFSPGLLKERATVGGARVQRAVPGNAPGLRSRNPRAVKCAVAALLAHLRTSA